MKLEMKYSSVMGGGLRLSISDFNSSNLSWYSYTVPSFVNFLNSSTIHHAMISKPLTQTSNKFILIATIPNFGPSLEPHISNIV